MVEEARKLPSLGLVLLFSQNTIFCGSRKIRQTTLKPLAMQSTLEFINDA